MWTRTTWPDTRSSSRACAAFFEGLRGFSLDGLDSPWSPSLLQSYSPDGEDYRMTIAFSGLRDGAPALRKIVELEAVRSEDGFRFRCPFERRTADLQRTTSDQVTFHHGGPLDAPRAERFAVFHRWFNELTDCPTAPLDYYALPGLRELLDANGFEFDATKCNFLEQDLGFLDGPRYQTGTGRADYLFGYVVDHLEQCCPDASELYSPYVTGLAAYLGGYSLSADDMATLKRQFRDELERRPELDFLEEFRAGRSASVHRHFSHYVMCAFVCEAVAQSRGAEAALGLGYSGAEGERFFASLRELLGVDESEFHDFIAERIQSPTSAVNVWEDASTPSLGVSSD